MKYTFEILGVSPILYFFNQQQEVIQQHINTGVEYLGSYKCTLDAFLSSAETVLPKQIWDYDQVVKTMINFWMTNNESIQYWKARLADADQQSLLVARVADLTSLKAEFESLL